MRKPGFLKRIGPRNLLNKGICGLVLTLLLFESTQAQAIINWEFSRAEYPLRQGEFLIELNDQLVLAGGTIQTDSELFVQAGFLIVNAESGQYETTELGRGFLTTACITEAGNIVVGGEIKISDSLTAHAMMLDRFGTVLWAIELERWPESVVWTSENNLRFLCSDHIFEVDTGGNLLWQELIDIGNVWEGRAAYQLDSTHMAYTGDNTLRLIDSERNVLWNQTISPNFSSGVAIEDLVLSDVGTIYMCGTVHTDTTWVDDWGEIYWQSFEDSFIASVSLSGDSLLYHEPTNDFGLHHGGYNSLLIDDGELIAAKGSKIIGQSMEFEVNWINQWQGGRSKEIIRHSNDSYIILSYFGDLTSIQSFDLNSMSVASPVQNIPNTFDLHPGFPNPFNGTVRFMVENISAQNLEFFIYDFLGRQIYYSNLPKTSPELLFIWDGKNAAGRIVQSGVYLLRVSDPNYSQYEKILFVK